MKEILMISFVTVLGCWGVHRTKTNMEIRRFDRQMKEWKGVQKNTKTGKNVIH